MTNKSMILLTGAALLVGIAAFFVTNQIRARFYPSPSLTATTTYTTPVTIEAFVTQMITDLSPVKASLGGTYYVTEIDARGGTGTVHFEDGHSAYVADFTYTVTDAGVPSVSTFTIRK